MTDRDWIEVCLPGGELDDAGHVELERQLTETPDNLELRIRRLGFLFAKELPRAHEVLWLATQHPGIDLGGFTVFQRDEDPEVYEQVRLAWKLVLESSPENSIYREQAARFASHDDPPAEMALEALHSVIIRRGVPVDAGSCRRPRPTRVPERFRARAGT